MNLEIIFDAVGSLGLPIVITILLIWHLIRLNRSLTAINQGLLEELAKLRADVNASMSASASNEKLLEQNERLVETIQQTQRDSMNLVRQWVESSILNDDSSDRAMDHG